MLEYSEKVRLAQILHEAARQLRGRILNTTAVIDTQLAEIISHYFCRDEERRALFMSDVATSQFFSLRMKEDILKKIIRAECRPYLDQNPGIFKEFVSIRLLRNDIAHAIIDVSDEALIRGPASAIGFVSFKDGKRHVRQITQAESEDFNGRTGSLLGNLGDIARILGIPATYV